MRFPVFSVGFLAIAQTLYALPFSVNQFSTLNITLSRASDTRIKAVVENSGEEKITFVHLNFFGDSAPVKKVSVYKDSKQSLPYMSATRDRLILKQTTRSILTE